MNSWIQEAMKAMEDKGWKGPPVVYLLCYPHNARTNHTAGEPEFIAKVTPDPKWSFQRWHTGCFIQFLENVGEHLYYDVTEMKLAEGETHVAFETFPVYDVDGSKLASFD